MLTVVTLDAVMEVVSISAAALSTPHKLKAVVVAASWVSLVCAPVTRPFTRIALYILYDRRLVLQARLITNILPEFCRICFLLVILIGVYAW